MIQQEEIRIKQFSTGVTFYIFSDIIYNELPENPDQYEGPFPSYIVFNLQNEIYSLNFFTGNTIWTRNDNNNYIPIGELGWNYQTGYTLVKTIASDLSQENIDNMSNLMLSRLSDPTRPGTPPSASAATNYVFYRKKPIDDFYVDLKLERSYNSLDTLKINNNLVNKFPEQNSPTGVVFGRLMAIQKIKGENGENLRIPLTNVPIGIFNPSDDFPNTFSTDDNGDRLTLNIKESATPSDYFDNLSYYTDYNNYLRSAESFSAVPAQYKYITKTNENGEFIIYDVPVGEQLAIFEVDLFKQGLTKDEIALNFFPFPPTQEPNIDTLPSFAFKQFPIDVVPAWGLGQTGYTSLDININLDLRKWTTYIFPPVTYNGKKLNETVALDQTKTLKVDVRDMTSPDFQRRPVEIVQIPDDLDRDIDAQYIWFNEFSQKKTSIQYSNFGCNVFKLPGNIYDPNGYRTDRDGNPTSNKGVWLAAYQFNFYIDKTFSQRATGAVSYSVTGGEKPIRSHYHLNYTSGNQLPGGVESAVAQVGTFPYEKPWSASYPNQYSIPKKPTQQRVLWGPDRLLYPGSTASNPIYYAEEPTYSDGDLVGNTVYGSIGDAGGFGVQYFNTSWFYNRIANVATRSYMYKYEKGVSWSETYANGYQPYWTSSNSPYTYTEFPFAQISSVIGGEKYQRLECGYGYFLKPQGWLSIVRASWAADVPIDSNYLNGYGSSENPGPATAPQGIQGGWFFSKSRPLTIYNTNNQNFTLHLGPTTAIKEGTIDFYRIVESGPDKDGNFVNLSNSEPFFIPTSSYLKIEGAFHCYSVKITNKGIIPVQIENPFRGTIRVDNPNGSFNYYGPGQAFTLDVNSSFVTQDTPASVAIYGAGTNILGQAVQNNNNIDTNNFSDYQQFFYDNISNFRRIDLPSDNYYAGYPIYVRDIVSFTTIKLPGNASVSSDNTNILLSSLYDVEVKYYVRDQQSNVAFTNPTTNQQEVGLSLGSAGARVEALNQSRTFTIDYANYEAFSNSSDNALFGTWPSGNGQIGATVTKTFNGSANIIGSNVYYIRTETYGSNSGLIHEGIGKTFFYGNNDYYNRDDYPDGVYFYTMKIEGPTSGLWGNFNDGNEDYGYGRYAP